jgi:hypothetical protein
LKRTLLIIYSLIVCSCWLQLHAQASFEQKLDSTNILIGDQQHLTLVSSDNQLGDKPFRILDTLSWFQIVNKGSWIAKDQLFERKILFTVFDSGYFMIPPLGIFNENDSVYSGNPLYLEVNYPADSLNVLRPIKSIEETEAKFKYLYLVIGILLIAGMLFVLWQFFKADRIKPSVVTLEVEKKIWEKALESLSELEEKKLWQNNRVKEYYDELNHILRYYLSAGLKIPALENTSSEILDYIKNQKPELQNADTLKQCFTESDLVKFAKHIPDASENENWLAFSKDFVEMHKDLSERILEETRVHWMALLGESMAQQFESPHETVPPELIQLYSSKTRSLELLYLMVNRKTFHLPEGWVKWHLMHTGIFYRWQMNILNISKHKIVQILLFVFVLPFVALFLPVIWLMNFRKKEDIFSRGVFGLSANNKLLVRKR